MSIVPKAPPIASTSHQAARDHECLVNDISRNNINEDVTDDDSTDDEEGKLRETFKRKAAESPVMNLKNPVKERKEENQEISEQV